MEVALITGASKGIGRITSFKFAEKNINVCLLARNYQRCKKIAEEIEKKYKVIALPIKSDVSNYSSVKKTVYKIIEKFHRIDYVVNLAGYPLDLSLWKKQVHETEEKEILKILNVDFLGSFRIIKECLPYMIKQGKGVIVNISSTPALQGDNEGFVYALAKSLCITLTKFIARQYGKYNIRAYTLVLGSIRTKSTYNLLSKKERKRLAEETALKRWGEPEEIANLITCIVKDDFSYVTGQSIIADGGVIMI